jgi:hypothetical protein
MMKHTSLSKVVFEAMYGEDDAKMLALKKR